LDRNQREYAISMSNECRAKTDIGWLVLAKSGLK
jgi:hypothetical protein